VHLLDFPNCNEYEVVLFVAQCVLYLPTLNTYRQLQACSCINNKISQRSSKCNVYLDVLPVCRRLEAE
jgi:hypothetical protein